MKKIIILLFFLALLKSACAQNYVPFPDSNAVWSEQHFQQGFCGPPDYCRYQYKMIGDTSIGSFQYHKIYKQEDTLWNSANLTYFGALREEAKKIYFLYYNCPFEFLLYDFSGPMRIGDTVGPIHCVESLYTCDSTFVSYPYGIIDNIDSTLIDGNYLKIYCFNVGTCWIEGIGSIYGPFNPAFPPVTCICDWDLVCFHQNDSVKYINPDFGDCFPTITSVSSHYKSEISVVVIPNPVTTISVIKWDNYNSLNYTSLIITDILGQHIKTLIIVEKNEVSVSRDYFPGQGLFLGRLLNANGDTYSMKLIIQ